MLKAGEFSPNNPLIRGERVTGICGDAFLGLGEYERRRNTLRKIRQAQYREFLDRVSYLLGIYGILVVFLLGIMCYSGLANVIEGIPMLLMIRMTQ